MLQFGVFFRLELDAGDVLDVLEYVAARLLERRRRPAPVAPVALYRLPDLGDGE